MSDLATRPPSELAVKIDETNPIGAMLAGIINNGVTKENVDAVKELTRLYMEVRADDAKRAYDAAYAAMQPEITKIVAVRSIPRKNGAMIKFADHFDIQQHMAPLLARHGFTVSVTTDSSVPGFINATMIVSHKAGHREHRSLGSMVGGGGDFSPAQKVEGTLTTLQRALLCATFNIPVLKRDDAGLRGEPIDAALAAAFEARVRAVGGNADAFLRYAGAATFAEIPTTAVDKLEHELRRKEAKPPTPARDAPPAGPPDLSTFDGFRAAMTAVGLSQGAAARDVGGAVAKLSLDHGRVKADGAAGDPARARLYEAATHGAVDWVGGRLVE